MPLYAFTLLGSILVPLLYNLIKKDYIVKWKFFLLSTSLIAIPFLIWDVLFTKSKIWGFNEEYLLGFHFLKLPIEEWLFFWVIPFCSLFIHFVLKEEKPNLKFSKKNTQIITLSILLLSLGLIITNYSNWYTLIDFSFLFITLLIGYIYKLQLLQRFYISFLIILIPFFIVNGILTGIATETPIVWYDDTNNLGIRLFTIPIEDIGYAFSMLFANLMIFSYFKNSKNI